MTLNVLGSLPLPFARCSSVPMSSKHSRETSAHAPPDTLPGLTSLKMASRRDGSVRVRSESSRKANCCGHGRVSRNRRAQRERVDMP